MKPPAAVGPRWGRDGHDIGMAAQLRSMLKSFWKGHVVRRIVWGQQSKARSVVRALTQRPLGASRCEGARGGTGKTFVEQAVELPRYEVVRTTACRRRRGLSAFFLVPLPTHLLPVARSFGGLRKSGLLVIDAACVRCVRSD